MMDIFLILAKCRQIHKTYITIDSQHSFNNFTAIDLSTSSIRHIMPMVTCSLFGDVNISSCSPKFDPFFNIPSYNFDIFRIKLLVEKNKMIGKFERFTLNLLKLSLIVGSTSRTQVKCVGRCFRRQFITISSIRRRAKQTDSRFVPVILMSSDPEPCFGITISVRVSPSMRFFTEPFAPIMAPKNALLIIAIFYEILR